jgi:2-desacetyl-2-hydroxyethyl bacteriochlorophyllide A dehydrogenase
MDARALVISGPGSLTVEAWPAAMPRPDEAVVSVTYGGICGSDVHYWKDGHVGESVLRSPMVLGHEVVGVVAEPAPDGSGLARGTRVAIHPAQVCGRCGYCRQGAQHLCKDLRYLGSAARVPHTDGGFAEHLVVSANRLVPIPDELDMRTAALAEPASVALHGLRRVERLGHRVEGGDILVIGAGPIGLLTIALATASGARTVTATDVFDRPLRLARQAGATHVVRADADVPIPDGDIAIESSGSPQGLGTALMALRQGGVVVSVGHLPSSGVTAPLHLAVTRELILAGSSRFYHEMPAALSIMSCHVERFAPIVTSVFGLDEAEPAFQEAADAERSSKVLLSFASAEVAPEHR